MATTASTPSTDHKDIIARVDEDGVEFIRLWFTDINGQLKSFSVGREELEGALADGMGFDGSSITGFNAIEESDMIAMPDPDTYTLLPWRTHGEKGNVARMFCDVLKPGGEPYEGDPRFVMRRALARAKDMGFDTFNLGPELEFFYFASDDLPDDGVPEILDKGGYFDLTTLDAASDLRRDTVNALKAVGIPVEYTHHEVGPSQHEIDMRYAEGLKMSDAAMTYRIVVKEIAAEHGVYATFMPKPLFGENGSGMHTHQSLFSGGKNAFYDAEGDHHLSEAAKSYIAGLLRHAREIAALFAPNVNSYKRLVPGYEAPVNLVYSQRNRSASVRIPLYSKSPKAKRLECRFPDPSCNPYLAFSAMLMAGLDGIANRIEPPTPVDRDLYDLPAEELAKVPQVPGSLNESLASLEADHEFLLAGGVFTPDVIDTWIEFKRTNEIDPVQLRTHPWEFYLYYDI